jgi:hypothetical protein
MTAILTDLYLQIPAADPDPAVNFLFRGVKNVYSNQTVATATGISEATDDQSASLPYTPVKELIRAGFLQTSIVSVSDTTSTKTYYKTLHYGSDKDEDDVETAIQAIKWPTGKGQGGVINGFVTRTRVKGRMD